MVKKSSFLFLFYINLFYFYPRAFVHLISVPKLSVVGIMSLQFTLMYFRTTANKTSLDIPFIKEGWKREEAWWKFEINYCFIFQSPNKGEKGLVKKKSPTRTHSLPPRPSKPLVLKRELIQVRPISLFVFKIQVRTNWGVVAEGWIMDNSSLSFTERFTVAKFLCKLRTLVFVIYI